MTRFFPVLALLLASNAFAADDYPTLGLVYNTKEWASLNYECDLVNPSLLECSFAQVGVRRKATDADLAKLLSQVRAETTEPINAEECNKYSQYLAAAEGRGQLPKGATLPESAEHKADSVRLMRALLAYCEKPTPENLKAAIRAGHDTEARTCVVRSWTFKQTFTPVTDTSRKKTSWIVKSSPSGACATVQLDRFEREILPYAPDLTAWKYVARKAVTNPSGEGPLGMKCSDSDEDTYLYTSDITKNNHPARCDYIEFAAF